MPGYAEPEHGDIIVFRADHSPGMDLVKRTVGLPDDTLRMEGGVLYRNGVEVEVIYFSYDRDALEPFRVLTAMRPGRIGFRPNE